MHVYRIVRRRVREARYLGEPVTLPRLAGWTWQEVTYDLRVLAEVLGGPR
jgi:hypothetical protein